jgi:hypothetical protein
MSCGTFRSGGAGQPSAVSLRPEGDMMQGETVSRARSTTPSRPPRRPTGFLPPRGCVTYEVNDDTIEVIVTDAPTERQGRRELHLYLDSWRAQHPGLELELLD